MAAQDDDDIERLLLAHSPRLQTILTASRKQIQEGAALGHEEFWAEVEAPRAAKRRARKQSPLTRRDGR